MTATLTEPAPPLPTATQGRTLRPRAHQVDALDALRAASATADRMQLRMACGTGKTFVGRWRAQAVRAKLTLVFCPSLALVAQTLGEWRRGTDWPFEALVVCSDPSTGAGAAERRGHEGADAQLEPNAWARRRAKVTTSMWDVAAFMADAQPDRPRVIFSTYHSAPVVAAGQAQDGGAFDLKICDEAHHLAGRPRQTFRAALKVRSASTVFMTATPVILTGDGAALSMDAPEVFGPVAHSYGFGQAIKDGRLVDYEVLVLDKPAETAPRGADSGEQVSALAATVLGAMHKRQLRSLITYHSRNAKAQAFAAAVDGIQLPDGRTVRARHISGKTPAAQRAQTLRWLGDTSAGEVRVVANVRCLVEGVDVPGVDGVVFADPSTSSRDIVQAVGRALRPAPGKRIGSIILPVTVPANGDDSSELLASCYGHVWNTLRAIRAHDQRLAAELDAVEPDAVAGRWPMGAPRGQRLAQRIIVDVPDIDPAAIYLRIVSETTSTNAYYLGLVREWAHAHPGVLLPANVRWQGKWIGRWGEQQRRAHRKRLLTDAQVAALEAIPCWVWDLPASAWRESYARLADLAHRLPGGLHQPSDEPSIYAGLRDATGRPLGHFSAQQRQLWRDEMLPAPWAAALEKLPGWSWDAGLPADDIAMVQALRLYGEFERHLDVPEAHAEGGLEVGRWGLAVRRRRFTGRLHPSLAEEIEAASSGWDDGQPAFHWNTAETKWRLHYSALRQYTRREGSATPPPRHHERLPDTVVDVGAWAEEQHAKYAKRRLDQRYSRWLEALPGWSWRPPQVNGATSATAGRTKRVPKHGSYTRYVHGPDIDGKEGAPCRCTPCRQANARAVQAHADRKRTGEVVLVDADPVREHVEMLAGAGLGFKRVAQLAGVPHGVMSKLLYGDRPRGLAPSKRVRPATAQKILAVKPDRNLLPDGALEDGAMTRRRLQALVALGWSQSHLACRLGLTPSNFGKMLHSTGKVRLGTARAVARLYDELRDQRPEEDGHRAKISASRARGQARNHRWLPPAAWDDAQLELPEADLRQRLDRQVAAMDDTILRQCYELSRDPSIVLDPLAAAAAAAWAASPRRRKLARRSA